MTHDQLSETVKLCLSGAKTNLERDGHLVPAGIIFYGENKYDLVALHYYDGESNKQNVANQFIALARKLQATAVVTIFDAWAAMVKEIPKDKRVRDLPEARDVIVVSGHMPDYQTMACSYYVKTDKGFVFDDDNELANASPGQSRFTDGIWETHGVTNAIQ